jgi:hypothetical protein
VHVVVVVVAPCCGARQQHQREEQPQDAAPAGAAGVREGSVQRLARWPSEAGRGLHRVRAAAGVQGLWRCMLAHRRRAGGQRAATGAAAAAGPEQLGTAKAGAPRTSSSWAPPPPQQPSAPARARRSRAAPPWARGWPWRGSRRWRLQGGGRGGQRARRERARVCAARGWAQRGARGARRLARAAAAAFPGAAPELSRSLPGRAARGSPGPGILEMSVLKSSDTRMKPPSPPPLGLNSSKYLSMGTASRMSLTKMPGGRGAGGRQATVRRCIAAGRRRCCCCRGLLLLLLLPLCQPHASSRGPSSCSNGPAASPTAAARGLAWAQRCSAAAPHTAGGDDRRAPLGARELLAAQHQAQLIGSLQHLPARSQARGREPAQPPACRRSGGLRPTARPHQAVPGASSIKQAALGGRRDRHASGPERAPAAPKRATHSTSCSFQTMAVPSTGTFLLWTCGRETGGGPPSCDRAERAGAQ